MLWKTLLKVWNLSYYDVNHSIDWTIALISGHYQIKYERIIKLQ